MKFWGVRGVHVLKRKDTQVNLISPWCTLVGEDNEGYENIIGSDGVGERNDNGERLVDFCRLNNLVVTGAIFST